MKPLPLVVLLIKTTLGRGVCFPPHSSQVFSGVCSHGEERQICICGQVVLGVGSLFHPEKGMMGISLEVASRSHLFGREGKRTLGSTVVEKGVCVSCDTRFWPLLLDSRCCFLDIVLTQLLFSRLALTAYYSSAPLRSPPLLLTKHS